MSRSSCAVAAAVVSVICLLMTADSQSIVDESPTACTSSSPCSNADVVRELKTVIASNQEELKEEFKDMKKIITQGMHVEQFASALVANCVPLLIQQNLDGSNFFNRSWEEFKVGFNDTRGNYWLGNELLSQLTLYGRYKLRFDLQSRFNLAWYYAEYNIFIVLGELHSYQMLVSGYSGNAGADAFSYQNFMPFTTYDRDNDQWPRNCAAYHGGGFWYRDCYSCGVNSARGRGSDFFWNNLPGGQNLQSSRMWLHC